MGFYVGRKSVEKFVHADETLCGGILKDNGVSGLSFVDHGDSMRIYMVTNYPTTRSYISASLNGPLSKPITIESLISGEVVRNMEFYWDLSLHGQSPITLSEELSFQVWNALILNAPEELSEYVNSVVNNNEIEAQMGIAFADMAMRILMESKSDKFVPLWVPHYPGYWYTSELGEMSSGELGIEFSNGDSIHTISLLTSEIENNGELSRYDYGPDIVVSGLNALSEEDRTEAINYLQARKNMLENMVGIIQREGENGFLQQKS